MPPDTSDFVEFTRDAVTRHKDQVRYWEVWNEPNGWFWKPTPDATAYARLLRATYLAVKEEDPRAKVVFGAIFRNDHGYLERVCRALDAYPDARANRHFFDVLCVHPYSGALPPDASEATGVAASADGRFAGLPKMKATMERHGEPVKHVIVTEVAWPVTSLTWTPAVGRDRQADYLVRAYDMAQRWLWLDAMLWYGIKDSRGGEEPWSLVEPNLTPRPAFEAYRKAARGLD